METVSSIPMYCKPLLYHVSGFGFLVFWMLCLKSNTDHVDGAANAEFGPEVVSLLPVLIGR